MNQRHKVLLTVAALLLLTLWAALTIGTPRVDDTPPLAGALPATIGTWQGRVPLYCQREACLFTTNAPVITADAPHCPRCNGPLETTALAEQRILPAGTDIIKRVYQRGHERVFVSVLTTGHQRSGIHRPQWCLPSQGLAIQRTRVIECTVSDGHVLSVSLLAALPKSRMAGGGLFAYWFADRDHETATHWQRLGWMAYNDLIRGVRRPWAYVSLWIPGRSDPGAVERMRAFIAELYPHLQPAPAAPPTS